MKGTNRDKERGTELPSERRYPDIPPFFRSCEPLVGADSRLAHLYGYHKEELLARCCAHDAEARSEIRSPRVGARGGGGSLRLGDGEGFARNQRGGRAEAR
jgi:hypothetical protein